ncbi:uncharacterized protein TEOVI_000432100 [Trypanosoma equiperdum]|uniref:Uncharacterized protein n=1 Tax=Trypanosoma equiperdum TaxID=5694 RepID=A0A1G4IJR5_TRYEQ|nr:hypothetical protein, conserved [Trypanosoma equiperdum]
MDPLLLSREELEEAQRAIKRRRDTIRTATTERIQTELQPTGSGSLAKRTVPNSIPDKEKAESNSGVVKKLKEELRRRTEELENSVNEQRRAREEYKRLKSVFESFVVEVCEREEAYKIVFSKAYEEVEKHKKHCEGLQRQLEERSSTTTVAATVQVPVADTTTPPVAVGSRTLHEIIDQFRTMIDELECRVGCHGSDDNQSRVAATDISNPDKHRRSAATGTRNRAEQKQKQQVSEGKHQLQPHGQNDQPKEEVVGVVSGSVVPARGAAVLSRPQAPVARSAVSAPKKRRAAKSESAAAVKRAAAEKCNQASTSSLFTSFSTLSERPKKSEVNFGSEPIEDYLTLLKKTDLSKVDVLRRELMNFCNSDVNVVATYVVEHFLRKALLTPPMTALWNETVEAMHIDVDVFPAFVRLVVRKLVHLLGPDTAVSAGNTLDHSPQLQRLSLVLRLACVVRLRETESGGDALFFAFYESTISALRSWRLSSTAEGQRDVLKLWMIAVRHLYGFVEDFHMLTRYYANTDGVMEALTLPKLLTCYAVRAVMGNCYFIPSAQPSLVEVEADVQLWTTFCDTMDWSGSELPIDGIGAAAVNILSHSTDERSRGEALLSLRLLVLQKGFGFLQSLTERLRVASGDVDVDEAFAELFSLAVVDLQLEDPLDDQWDRAMSFFMDYLYNCSVEQVNSVEELLTGCKEAHLLVLRAVFQLCSGTGALAEQRVEHATRALRWLKALRVGLDRSARGVASSPLTSVSKGHLLDRTSLGKDLVYLCRHDL